MIKPKVLVVPAWYPASFFTEQMKLVEDTFEFKVFIGERHELGKKKAIKKILNGKFRQFTWFKPKSISDNTDIINVDYLYVNSLSSYFERKQYKYLNRGFENKFQELIESGWTPDLVHIQSLSDTAVFICNWAEKHNIPIILTEHIIYIRRTFNFFQKEKERVYSRVDKVLCVSNYVYRNLLVNGFRLKDVEIIGNLVDDRYLSQSLENKKEPNKILFVATHLFDKDIEVLLQAIKILVDLNFTDIKVDILGINPAQYYQNDTNSLYFLKNEIDSIGLSRFIEIKGLMSRENVLKSYNKYSLLVSTSFSETFGLCIAEALVNGLPVICTDSGGIRDFVDQTNGIIVPIRNANALANSIVYVNQNIRNYNPYLISSNISMKYGTRAFADKLISVYNKQILQHE
jgi:glycosyltransferase involved in cell wall biosynthesis